MRAAELFEQKIRPLEVVRRLRGSRKSAYQWHPAVVGRRCAGSGPPGPERIAMPSVPALAGETGRVSGQGPAAHGWVEGQVWAAARVATLIGRKSHLSSSVFGATRLTPRLGFSPQMPG